MRFITIEMLKRQGCNALEAATAKDALQKIRDVPSIDLVLSDLGLPEYTGHGLANAIGSLKPDVKVLLMSGNASRSPPADGETKAGSTLQKPFNAEALKRYSGGCGRGNHRPPGGRDRTGQPERATGTSAGNGSDVPGRLQPRETRPRFTPLMVSFCTSHMEAEPI